MRPAAFIINHNKQLLNALVAVLREAKVPVKAFASVSAFLQALHSEMRGCVIIDARPSTRTEPDLQSKFEERDVDLPIIYLSSHDGLRMSARTLRAGAFDILENRGATLLLLDRLRSTLAKKSRNGCAGKPEEVTIERLARLTKRERELLPQFAAGHSSKDIGRRLGISHRTVEGHRANIMQKTGARNSVELAKLADSSGLRGQRT